MPLAQCIVGFFFALVIFWIGSHVFAQGCPWTTIFLLCWDYRCIPSGSAYLFRWVFANSSPPSWEDFFLSYLVPYKQYTNISIHADMTYNTPPTQIHIKRDKKKKHTRDFYSFLLGLSLAILQKVRLLI
jgi:hypothetical protein